MLSTPLEAVRSLWIGANLPAAQRACIASFLRVGHPFELFTYDEVEGIPPGTLVRSGEEILPRDRIFMYGAASGGGAGGVGGFSNLFRYALLLKEGGYWVDTDTFCLRPLAMEPIVISSEWSKTKEIVPNCGVLKFPPGHRFSEWCFGQADAADTETLVFGTTGPALTGAAVKEFELSEFVVSPDVFCSVNWFQYQTLCEPGVISEHALGLHLWGECWRRKLIPIPWPGPEGSILHSLASTLESVPASA